MAAQKKHKNLINLLPSDEFQGTTLGRILRWLLGTFRIIVIATEMIVMIAFLSRFWFDAKSNDLSDEINQKKAVIASYANVEKNFKAVQSKLNVFKAITTEDKKITPFIESVAANLPADTFINNVTLSGGSILVDASTASEQSASAFIGNLSSVSSFKNVSLTRIESRPNDPTLNFTVKLDLAGGIPNGS